VYIYFILHLIFISLFITSNYLLSYPLFFFYLCPLFFTFLLFLKTQILIGCGSHNFFLLFFHFLRFFKQSKEKIKKKKKKKWCFPQSTLVHVYHTRVSNTSETSPFSPIVILWDPICLIKRLNKIMKMGKVRSLPHHSFTKSLSAHLLPFG